MLIEKPINALVYFANPAQGQFVKDRFQVLEGVRAGEAAVLPPGGVGGQAVVAASLDVQRHQVQSARQGVGTLHTAAAVGDAALEEMIAQLQHGRVGGNALF